MLLDLSANPAMVQVPRVLTQPIDNESFAVTQPQPKTIKLVITDNMNTHRYSFDEESNPRDVYNAIATQKGIEPEELLLLEKNNRDRILPKNSNLSLGQWAILPGQEYVVEEDLDSYHGFESLDIGQEQEDDKEIEVTI